MSLKVHARTFINVVSVITDNAIVKGYIMGLLNFLGLESIGLRTRARLSDLSITMSNLKIAIALAVAQDAEVEDLRTLADIRSSLEREYNALIAECARQYEVANRAYART